MITKISSLMIVMMLPVVLVACGGGGGGATAGSDATIVVTSSDAGAGFSESGFVSQILDPRGNVTLSPDDSLTIDITKVTVHLAGSDDEAEEEEEEDDENEPSASGWITLFESGDGTLPITLDLVELQALSEVLTSAHLPEGKYTKLVIYYENPHVIVDLDGPGGNAPVDSTDIQVTANGRLFVSQNFTIDIDEPVLILIDFSTLSLADTGPTRFTLNPQLDVTIDISSALIDLEGTIVEITDDPEDTEDTQSIAVDTGEAILDVIVTGDTGIIGEYEVAPTDTAETMTIELIFEDLSLADVVEVEGVLQVNGSVIADEIALEVEPPFVDPV